MWNCDVCGDKIHLKKINGKNVPVRCPLEKFKNVKSFYSVEFRLLLNKLFFDEFPLSNSPEDLKEFSEYIPDETILMKYVKKVQDDAFSKNWEAYTKSLIISSSIETFFVHFTSVLLKIYDDNRIHYIDSPLEPKKSQFNYLWLSPTTLRECYFSGEKKDLRFKSMTDLGKPSLVIYPIGNVMSVDHKAWGDIVMDLITHRQSLGKPTWILQTKKLTECAEIKSGDNLRNYLQNSNDLPKVVLDSDEDMLISGNSDTSNSYGF